MSHKIVSKSKRDNDAEISFPIVKQLEKHVAVPPSLHDTRLPL